MKVNDFDYCLPEELIAKHPCENRDESRLLVLDKDTGKLEHRRFYDVIDYLTSGDLLVLNNSKVLPARIYGRKESTGAAIEFLLTKRHEGDVWQTLVKPGKRLKTGDRVIFAEDFEAEIVGDGEDGTRLARFTYDGIFMERLDEIGVMPLPPYIDREAEPEDKDRYQTVYARYDGSVAAPTAGLHFTDELLEKIEKKGVRIAYVTLHVGIGTFRPVKADNVEDHHMHFEEYEISEDAARLINETKAAGSKVICVGTTSTRTIESAALQCEKARAEGMDKKTGAEIQDENSTAIVSPGPGSTDIFIYPGYEFRVMDSLITNFHLPKSTLVMLVSALAGRENVLNAYEEAIGEKYRFFSYGDAMLIK